MKTFKKFKQLTRNELQHIKGGEAVIAAAAAIADCGGGHTVSCSGTYNCTAEDFVGCDCDDGTDHKDCIIA